MLTAQHLGRWQRALPFWISFLLLPVAWVAAALGGWALLLVPGIAWYLFIALDGLTGLDLDNADPQTPDEALTLYILLTKLWVPAQFCTLFGLLWYVDQASHLSSLEKVGLFFGMGVIGGTIGINYAHELMHQKSPLERWGADILLAMVLYSHFRSEHLLVHHRYVGTPRDPVTARYNESFYRFYPRVLWNCLKSAFAAEARMMRRRGLPWYAPGNPFWRYAGLQLAMMGLAVLIAGWSGLILLAVQAGVAIWQLELVNYVEHYGLTRKHLGEGKYEHVLPRHSWNSAFQASNWLLINLQRHSDHHYKPDRRFPLLQTHSDNDAPQLPYGYPVMTFAAMIPPVWRRVMNPRVRAWRSTYYPEIEDWQPYNKLALPLPRGI